MPTAEDICPWDDSGHEWFIRREDGRVVEAYCRHCEADASPRQIALYEREQLGADRRLHVRVQRLIGLRRR